MNRTNRTKALATVICLILIGILLQEPFAVAVSSSSLKKRADVSIITGADWDNVIDHLRDQRKEASYIIYLDGNTVKALNGTTGNVDFSETNATTVIQYTINNGDSTFIKGGIYEISAYLTLDDDQILTGEGSSSILKLTSNLTYLIYASTGTTLSNIKITNLAFDGDRTVRGGTTYAFELDDAVDSEIAFNNIYNFTGGGVYFKGATTNGIDGRNKVGFNTFYNLGYPAVELGLAGGGGDKGSHSNIVTNNIIRVMDRAAIRLWMSHRNIITGNRIINTGTEAIDVVQSGQNVIDSNVIEGGDKATITNIGIAITAESNGSPYFAAEGNVVSNNFISKMGTHGIMLAAGRRTLISGNTLRDNSQLTNSTYDGILISFVGTFYSTYNRVIGNYIQSTGSPLMNTAINELNSNNDYNVYIGNIIEGTTIGLLKFGANSKTTNNLNLTSWV